MLFAAELEDNCVSLKCDTTTQLEAKAYHHYMMGMLLFEQTQWQRAVVSLSAAQKIYNKLAGEELIVEFSLKNVICFL